MLLTGETQGYYRDYRDVATARHRARARRPALSIRAKPRRIAAGNCAASRAASLPPTAFVNFLQNHDQIGNRALGDRLESNAKPDGDRSRAWRLRCWRRTIPMLFMGEEWGSKAPFPFFCDFKGDLADAVRKGRRREFAWAYAKYGDEVPDPLDRVDLSIRGAGLGRAQRSRRDESGWRWCENLLAIRRREIVPRLAGAAFGEAHAADNGLLTAHWRLGDGATLRLTANLSDQRDRPHANVNRSGTPIWGGETERR